MPGQGCFGVVLGLGVLVLLGGSWVAISGVISPLIWVLTIVTLLISPLITTQQPPSRGSHGIFGGFVGL